MYLSPAKTRDILDDGGFRMDFSDFAKINKIFLPYVKSGKQNDWAAIVIDIQSKKAYYLDGSFGAESDSEEEDRSIDFLSLSAAITKWLSDSGCVQTIVLQPFRITGLRCYENISEACDSGIFIATAFQFIYKHCPITFSALDMAHFRYNLAHSILQNRIPEPGTL